MDNRKELPYSKGVGGGGGGGEREREMGPAGV